MSKYEQHPPQLGTFVGKEGGCCGGAGDPEPVKLDKHVAEQVNKTLAASRKLHRHASHAAMGSCGFGGKHK